MIGTSLGRYMILREVGRGGMSTVYLSEDTALERQVAVKVLHPHLASRQESCARFSREARAIARLRHPNIVEIFDCSAEDATTRYIVTEFIDGPNLRDFVEAHDVSAPELGVALGFALCEALEHAHSLGIIHRDIKPENVLIQTAEGLLKLTDFGIAQILDADTLTATGSLLGSPAHMPPEMIDGLPVDFRGDIFSFGTVLYFLITNGLLPFEGKTPSAVLRNILEVRYRDPEAYNPRVGRQLSRIVKRCMARQPIDRFQTVTDVKNALREELADLGFDDPSAIVRSFLQRPDEYPDTFERLIIERLIDAARRALRRRQVSAAIDYVNRVLAYAPTHPGALQLLAQIQQRHRVRLIAAACVSVLLLGAAAYRLSPMWEAPLSQLSSASSDPAAVTSANLHAARALTAAATFGAVSGVTQTLPPAPPAASPPLIGAIWRDATALSSATSRALIDAIAQAKAEAEAEASPPLHALIRQRTEAASAWLLASLSDLHATHTANAADTITIARVSPTPRPPALRPNPADPTKTDPTKTDPTKTNPTDTAPVPAAAVLTPVSFRVFPRETSFAVLDKRRYASADGQITAPISPGLHRLTFGCTRCDPIEKTILIPDTKGTPYSFSETVRPPWKKATVTIDFSKFGEQAVYAFIQEGKQRPRVYQPDQQRQLLVPVEFSGAVPSETLTVFVYPNKPRSVSTTDMMAGAIDKASISVEPGDNLTLSFR
jgi:eukaryotic-like serine/threonine-protein kinase